MCVGDFLEQMGLAADNAILVRPDGHILAVVGAAGAEAVEYLRSASASYLAKPDFN